MLDAWATLCGVNKDNDDLVQELEMHDRLKSRRVADAMRKVLMQVIQRYVFPLCSVAESIVLVLNLPDNSRLTGSSSYAQTCMPFKHTRCGPT